MEADDVGGPPLGKCSALAERAKEAVNQLNRTKGRPSDVSREGQTKAIKDYVYASLDERCPDIAEHLKKRGKCFIVEVYDVETMTKEQEQIGFKVHAGQIAGLAVRNRRYLRRIYVIVDSPSGFYGVNNLADRYHYQIWISELDIYLSDVSGRGIDIGVAGLSDCPGERRGSTGVLRFDAPSDAGRPDCVVVTPLNDYVISSDINQSTGESEESFFCVNGEGMKEFESEIAALKSEEHLAHLYHGSRSNDPSALKRNQHHARNFGVTSLSVTNRSEKAFKHLPTPNLSNSTDCLTGLTGDGSLSDDLRDLSCTLSVLSTKVEKKFGLNLFSDEQRREWFAEKIAAGNKFEMITLAISLDLLGCHVDNLNSREDGYSWSVTYYTYELVGGELVRMHIGGYGRRICDTVIKRNENIDRLVEHIVGYTSKVPINLVEYSPKTVLGVQPNDDSDSPCNKKDEIFRPIHSNKLVYYQFFVILMARWLKERRERGSPMSLPEGLDIVLSFFRWTASASQARAAIEFAMKKIEQIKKAEMEKKDAEAQAERDRQRAKSRKKSSATFYSAPSPITSPPVVVTSSRKIEQPRKLGLDPSPEPDGALKTLSFEDLPEVPMVYLVGLALRDLTGSTAKGPGQRTQPHSGGASIDHRHEMESLKNLLKAVEWLNEETETLKRSKGYVVDSQMSLVEFSKAIAHLTQEFIGKLSKSVKKGGCGGIAHLNAHHITCVLALLGWIDIAHFVGTNFSRGSGTAKKLLLEFGLKCTKDTLTAIANDFFDSDLLSSLFDDKTLTEAIGGEAYRLVVTENVICKSFLIDYHLLDTEEMVHEKVHSLRFVDAVIVGGPFSDVLLTLSEEGRLVTVNKDGAVKEVIVGVKSSMHENPGRIMDLSVTSEVCESSTPLRWLIEGSEYKVYPTVPSKNAIVEERRDKSRKNKSRKTSKKRKSLGTESRACKRPDTGRIAMSRPRANSYPELHRNWGEVAEIPSATKQKRVRGIILEKLSMISQLFWGDLNGLVHGCWTEKCNIIRNASGDAQLQCVKHLLLEAQELITEMEECKCEPREVVEVLGSDFKDDYEALSKMVEKYEERKKRRDSLPRSAKIPGAQYFPRGTKGGDAGGEEHDEEPDTSHLDGDWIDEENCLPEEQVLNIQIGSFAVPRYSSLTLKHLSKDMELDSDKYLADLFEIRISDLLARIQVEEIEHKGLRYYNCSIEYRDRQYCSSDCEFGNKLKSKCTSPFSVGVYYLGINTGIWYESEEHSKFALLMVTAKSIDPDFVERKFLSSGNMSILYPKRPLARDYHSGRSDPIRLPIAAVARQNNTVLVFDLGFLRYLDFDGVEVVDVEESCDKMVALNRHHGYYDKDNIWRSHPKQTRMRLQAMKGRLHSRLGIRNCFSVLGEAKDKVFQSPKKTVTCQLGGSLGLEKGWTKIVVQHNSNSDRKDQYWYSPCNRKFRSQSDVHLFLECLSNSNNNDSKAYELFKEMKSQRKRGNAVKV